MMPGWQAPEAEREASAKFRLRVCVALTADLLSEREEVAVSLRGITSPYAEFLAADPVEPACELSLEAFEQRLRDSHLFVALCGYRHSSFFVRVVELAQDLLQQGVLRHALLLFKKMPPAMESDPGAAAQAVLDFRRRLAERLAVESFSEPDDLERLLNQKLLAWLRANDSLLKVAAEWSGRIEPSLFESMTVRERPCADAIIDLRRLSAEEQIPLEEAAYRKYLETPPPAHYQLGERVFFLTARYLLQAIREGNFAVCRHKPFIFPIHQFLSKEIRSAPPVEQQELIKVLLRWLNARLTVYETSRDFAACELGMCKAAVGVRALLDAVSDPGELPLVRYYGAMALGMIGAKEVVKPLLEIYAHERTANTRQAIAHTILFLTQLVEDKSCWARIAPVSVEQPTPSARKPAPRPDRPKKLRIFLCYAREDELMKKELLRSLKPLERLGHVETWHDGLIDPGTQWEHEIHSHLSTADLVLVLVSPDFMASQYAIEVELKTALRRHQTSEAKVIPVLLRPAAWYDTPVGGLQALPDDGRAITRWGDRDDAWLNVYEGLRRAMGHFQ
jgi:hypothetical protein